MKQYLIKISIGLYFILFVALSGIAQTPQAFKYQAVIRYSDGGIIQNQVVDIKISILAGSPVGNAVYSETHNVATNDIGIANINIGQGEIMSGDFTSINWGENVYFIQTDIDLTGTQDFAFIGTSQLLSVPYALYAANAVNVDDADADPTNEIQNLDIIGYELSISNGNSINLPEDNDIDPTNELQSIEINENTISISNGNEVDLPYDNDTSSNNELQTISINGNELSISDGNTVNLPPDDDADPENELQILLFNNDTLYLENGNWVYLGEYLDNTDNQTLELTGTNLSISNGNSVELAGEVDLDSDPTNEFQFLSFSSDTLYLTNGGYVVFPEFFDGNYNSLINTPTNLSDFNNDQGFITEEMDGSVDNEIQDLDAVLQVDNSAGNKTIEDLSNPINPQDAVNKAYVDELMTIIANAGITIIEADFSANQVVGIAPGEDVNFTDLSTNAAEWFWDFGDGNTSNEQNPTHNYANCDIYTVSLTVSNSFGSDIVIKSDYIEVFVCGVSSIEDIDNNSYSTIQIGNQCWMAENIKVTKYPNGNPIPHLVGTGPWSELESNNTDDAFCYLNNNANGEADIFGALYTWAAAMGDDAVSSSSIPSGVQGICPDGWHLPSLAEWEQLINYLEGADYAGGKLKEIGTQHWNSPNTGATNESGFTALPGNYMNGSGFGLAGRNGHFWSSTQGSSNYYARMLNLSYSQIEAYLGDYYKNYGRSVRCLRN